MKAVSASAPETRIQFGGVSASVFANQSKRSDGTSFKSRKVVVQVSYRDEAGNFQATHNLGLNDIPRAILALWKAYEHCLVAQRDEPTGT